MELNFLDSKLKRTRARVGRGFGSRRGTTSGRGGKGASARSGYKRKYGFEGGALPLYKKLPTRGFSRASFRKPLDTVNLGQVEKMFEEGELVNLDSLRKHGFLRGKSYGVKLLAHGELKKKVKFEMTAYSQGAIEKIEKLGLEYKSL